MLTPQVRLRTLSDLFTRPSFSTLSTKHWEHAFASARRRGLLVPGEERSIASVFENAWAELRASYRNEYVYKNELSHRLLFGRHRPHTASMQIELPVGRSIADIAIFNGTSTAYEIKTEFDTARRLQTQSMDYCRSFEKVYLVTHPDLTSAYARIVDERVGILALSKRASISVVRQAESCAATLDHRIMFNCMRREEYLDVIRSKMGIPLDLPNGLIAKACLKEFESLPRLTAHRYFVEKMRERTISLQRSHFLNSLPSSLKALGFATPLTLREQEATLKNLSREVRFALA